MRSLLPAPDGIFLPDAGRALQARSLLSSLGRAHFPSCSPSPPSGTPILAPLAADPLLCWRWVAGRDPRAGAKPSQVMGHCIGEKSQVLMLSSAYRRVHGVSLSRR